MTWLGILLATPHAAELAMVALVQGAGGRKVISKYLALKLIATSIGEFVLRIIQELANEMSPGKMVIDVVIIFHRT